MAETQSLLFADSLLPERDVQNEFCDALQGFFEVEGAAIARALWEIINDKLSLESWEVCWVWGRFVKAQHTAGGIQGKAGGLHYNAGIGEFIEDDRLSLDVWEPIFGFWRDGEKPVLFRGNDLCKRIISFLT
jgi:hypothetical protein